MPTPVTLAVFESEPAGVPSSTWHVTSYAAVAFAPRWTRSESMLPAPEAHQLPEGAVHVQVHPVSAAGEAMGVMG